MKYLFIWDLELEGVITNQLAGMLMIKEQQRNTLVIVEKLLLECNC